MSEKLSECKNNSFMSERHPFRMASEGDNKSKISGTQEEACALIRKFLDDTTVHGVRYIGKRDSRIVIRLFWLLMFLTCAALMSYQIIDRIFYYADWPVTVDLRINYNNSLSFPALTICNQNAFKTTATAKNNQYELLEDIFFGNLSKLTKYEEWKNITLRQLNIDNGHRKEDMIIKCKWAGQSCNSSFFRTTVTDHGLCFTFNGPQNNGSFTATASGAKSGLKLILNIEQYEYMPGPHEAAGVKILLHEPGEFPFISELGKALQIGTHTFVGVQMLKLHHLKKPRGSCGDVKLKFLDNFVHSPSACMADCRAKMLVEKCGCLDFNFPLNKDYRSCTVEDIPCIFKAKDVIRTISGNKCHCPVLCDSNHFQSEISFGSISKLALQQLMKKTDVSGIESQFIRAREVSQRKWKHVAKSFELALDRLQQSLIEYETALNKRLYRAILDSIDNIKQVYQATRAHWRKKRFYFKFQDYVLRKNILRGKEAYDERYFRFVAMNHYGFTAYITNVITSLFNVSEPFVCDDSNILVDLQAVIKSRLFVSQKAFIYMKEVLDSFRNGTPIFNYKFYGNSRAYGRAMLPKVLMKKALSISWNARNYGIKTADSIQNIVIVLEKYFNFTENICKTGHVNMSHLEEINKEFIKRCQGMYHNKHNLYAETIDWSYKELSKRISLFEEKWNLFESSYNAIEVNVLSFKNSWNKVNNSLFKIQNIINLAQNYITNTSITKVNLYEEFTSPEILSITNNISTFKTEIYTRASSTIDHWKTLSDIVQDIWKMIINDPDMKEYYEFANKTEYLVNISTIYQEIKSNFSQYINDSEFGSLIAGSDDQFLAVYKQMVEHLDDFVKSLKITETLFSDNFIKMEVFYRELSYEEVRQQAAYDIFALLCDIGGSMGLFIGASFMSLFEILDLLCHIFIISKKTANKYRL